MSDTAVEYIQRTADGSWRITDSRVSLDSVVSAYWDGKSPEAIAEEFPTLSAEYVYGAIAFYLRNKSEIDQYLSQQAHRWERLRQFSQTQHGPLLDRIRAQPSESAAVLNLLDMKRPQGMERLPRGRSQRWVIYYRRSMAEHDDLGPGRQLGPAQQ